MTTLLVGFDSAWTPTHSGALVGALCLDDGTFRALGPPRVADFREGEEVILAWQAEHTPRTTLILLDQPTIVPNATGQRPVEGIVASPVSARRGGMQPANTGRLAMFGKDAPVWPFLARFGGPAEPLAPMIDTCVFETYPVLSMIALGWSLPDVRALGRLPKYNPTRKKTFALSDWQHVCEHASSAFGARALTELVAWLDRAATLSSPRKTDQDGLDACLCLLVGLHLAEGGQCLVVGDRQTGYIVVPYGERLRAELEARCQKTGLEPSAWVHGVRMT
jgi:predicted RNase H-like nuclease